MKSEKLKQESPEPLIKSRHLEDELSGIDQPKKEDIQMTCERLCLPFTKENVMAIIYGDNLMLPERILPTWLKELQ